MKRKYSHRYYLVNSDGQTCVKSNDENACMAVAELRNYEMRKMLPKLVIGSGRNKKVYEDRYSVLRKIVPPTGQLNFFKGV